MSRGNKGCSKSQLREKEKQKKVELEIVKITKLNRKLE